MRVDHIKSRFISTCRHPAHPLSVCDKGTGLPLFARRECKPERARLERLQAPSLLVVVVVVVVVVSLF